MSTRLDIGDGTGLDKRVTEVVEFPTVKPKSLEPQPPAPPIGPGRGVGKAAAPKSTSTGTGASGVWTETSRAVWPDKVIASTDGVITWVHQPIKQVRFSDGGTSVLELNFLNP